MSYKRPGSPSGPGAVTTVAFKRPRASDFAEQPASYGTPGYRPPPPPRPPAAFHAPPPSAPAALRGPPPAAAGIPEGRRQGHCTHWDAKKAYGFLQDHANGPDAKRVFCHNSSLAWAGDASKEFASLNVGDEVEFEYTDGERGVEAIKVTAVAQVLGRRRGTVTAFNDEKGYGFVADDDPETVGNKEILVHHKKIKSTAQRKTLVIGERLEYGLVTTAKGFAAVEIVQLSNTASSAPPTAPAARESAPPQAPSAQPAYDYSAYGYQLGQDGQWYPTAAAAAPTTAEEYYALYGVYPGQSYPPAAPTAPAPPGRQPPPPPPPPEQRPPPVVPAVRPRDAPPPVRRPPQQAPPQAPYYDSYQPYQQLQQPTPPPPAETPPHLYAQQHQQHSDSWPQHQVTSQLGPDVSWGSRGPPPPSLHREPSDPHSRPFDAPRHFDLPPHSAHDQRRQSFAPASQHDGRPSYNAGYGETGGFGAPFEQQNGVHHDGWQNDYGRALVVAGYDERYAEPPRELQGGFGAPAQRGGRGEGPWHAAGGQPSGPRGGRGAGPIAGGPMTTTIMYDGRQVRGGAGEGPFGAYGNGW